MPALTGGKLSLFRFARTFGVWRVWDWFSRARHGGIGFGPLWFDPFDEGHVAFGLAEAVALQDDDRFQIRRNQLTSFLPPEVTSLSGYEPDQCFGTLARAVRQYEKTSTPYRFLSGPAGVEYELSVLDSDTIAVKVVWRRTRDVPNVEPLDVR